MSNSIPPDGLARPRLPPEVGTGPGSTEDKLSPEQRERINEAIDSIMEMLARRPAEILGPPSFQKAFVFGYWERLRKAGARPRRCVFPGCPCQSVRASHTLQRNGPLACIAERNHVLTPGFDLHSCKNIMVPIGIGQASTFPGFCRHHESMFFPLERRRALEADEDVKLQVFRTICRELVVKRQECEDLAAYLRAWSIVINLHGTRIVRTKLGALISPELNPRSFSTNGSSPLELFLAEELQAARAHVRFLEDVMQPASLANLKDANAGLSHIILRIAQPLPVCLAGLGNFHIKQGKDVKVVFAMLNVWPTGDGVTIVMSALGESESHLHTYFYSRLDRSLGPLEM